MRGLKVLLGFMALLMVAACGETAGDTIEANRPKMEEIRTALRAALANLPPVGVVQTSPSSGGLDPKPTYDLKSGTINTAFLSVEELEDGSRPEFDLTLDSDLARTLAWTGPKNPMAESALSSASEIGDDFEAALKTPYAVIYRPASYVKPVADSATSYAGGTLDLEAFVVRIDTAKTVAICRIQAAPSNEVSYSYREGEDPKARLEAFASSTMWDDARAKLSRCLADQTGGTFVFDRN